MNTRWACSSLAFPFNHLTEHVRQTARPRARTRVLTTHYYAPTEEDRTVPSTAAPSRTRNRITDPPTAHDSPPTFPIFHLPSPTKSFPARGRMKTGATHVLPPGASRRVPTLLRINECRAQARRLSTAPAAPKYPDAQFRDILHYGEHV